MVKRTQSLWKRGSAYPVEGEHVLTLPFSIHLPRSLLPSCEFHRHSTRGSIAYAFRVTGTRTGLRFNKSIVRAIPIITFHERGALLRDAIGPSVYKHTHRHEWGKKIRRGIWGEYSDVGVAVSTGSLSHVPWLRDADEGDCSSYSADSPEISLLSHLCDYSLQHQDHDHDQSHETYRRFSRQ